MNRPLGNYILVTQESASDTFQEGGIIVTPDISKTKPLHGYVASVGDEVTTLKEGDRILFEQWAGKAIKLDGKSFLLMPVASVYMILAPEVKVAVT